MRKYNLNTNTNLTKGTFNPTVLLVRGSDCGEVGPTFATSLAEARICTCVHIHEGRVRVTRKELRVRKCEDGAFTSGAAISTNTHQT